jgi:hypothetical protein
VKCKICQEFTQTADVLCVDGKIAAIGENLNAPEGARVIDASWQICNSRRHRSAHALRAAVHGLRRRRRLCLGHAGRRGRRHDHADRLCHSEQGRVARRRVPPLALQGRSQGRRRLLVPLRRHVVGRRRQRGARDGDPRQRARHLVVQDVHGLQGPLHARGRRHVQGVPAVQEARRHRPGARRERPPHCTRASRRCSPSASPAPRATR